MPATEYQSLAEKLHTQRRLARLKEGKLAGAGGSEGGGSAVQVVPGPGMIFSLGDQDHAEETQALYLVSDTPIRCVTFWYNDRGIIGTGATNLGDGWGAGWMNPGDTSMSNHYGRGEAMHANIWLADVDAYAVSPQFYNIDLPYFLSNIMFGHGPNYGELYVTLFTEFQNTYDDGLPRYAERLRMSYLNAVATIRAMTKPAGMKVRVGLGFSGYAWIGQTPDNSFWEPCIYASDVVWCQHMQDSANYLSGTADINDLIVRSVAQLGAYGIPVGIPHFELWGATHPYDDNAWTKFVTDCLNNDAWLAARKANGLFFLGYMQEPNINNTANEPTFTNAVTAMRRHRASSVVYTNWHAEPVAPTTPVAISGTSPVAVRTGVQAARTTASFSPPAGSVIAALVANNTQAGIQRTHTLTDSLSGTWIQRGIIGDNSGTDAPGNRGQAEIWVRKEAATGAAMTVTDTLDTAEGGALIVKALTSCSLLNPIGEVISASGAGSAVSGTLKAIDPNSLVIGIVSEWNTLAVGTAGANCTVSDGGAGPNITSYILRRTAATSAPGDVALTTTAPTTGTEWNFVAAEFRGV